MLHMFAGKVGRATGLRRLAGDRGWVVVDVDILNGEQFDLDNDEIWERYLRVVRSGACAFIWMAPPSATFDEACRSAEHPYGLPGVGAGAKERLRKATYRALRCAELARAAWHAGAGFAFEGSRSRSGGMAIFDLPEVKLLRDDYNALHVDFDLCGFGADAAEPTRVLYVGPDLHALARTCSHTHAPPTAARRTSAATRHPDALNRAIVDAIVEHYGTAPKLRPRQPASAPPRSQWQ